MQVGHIISLMRSGIDVAIVTAAGYPGQPDKFEERVAGLLAAFRKLRLPNEITDRYPPEASPEYPSIGYKHCRLPALISHQYTKRIRLAEGVHAFQRSALQVCWTVLCAKQCHSAYNTESSHIEGHSTQWGDECHCLMEMIQR